MEENQKMSESKVLLEQMIEKLDEKQIEQLLIFLHTICRA